MTSAPRDFLLRQFETATALANYHLDGLTTEECLWRPARAGLHVQLAADGRWVADWPEHERYDLGPPSIAWVTWHMTFWWSMLFDHTYGDASLVREQVTWPGSAEAVRETLGQLQQRWHAVLTDLGDDELQSPERSRWPMQERPFGDIVAWVNVELTKNAAELGYGRFLYAVRG